MIQMALHGLSAAELRDDIYFQPDFVRLHARPNPVDSMDDGILRHSASVRSVPGTDFEDLETPHGYGGPIALDVPSLADGLRKWRRRQTEQGRLAEFIRMHPFANALAYRDILDMVRFDRLTVLVDLQISEQERWRAYSKGTRHAINRSRKSVVVRRLKADEVDIFKTCYEEGLKRNRADAQYFFSDIYYRDLLSADWCTTWCAETADKVIAVASFLSHGPLAHYHLAGGLAESRNDGANYAMLEAAFKHFRAAGCRWMHLGGGRTAAPDDELYRFKSKFSTMRAAFYTGGMIFRADDYKRMSNDESRYFLSYRFAPTQSKLSVGTQLTLRPATLQDYFAFFRLRCSVEIMAWSGFNAPPSWDELSKWYESKLAPESGRIIYLGQVKDTVVGYAYADRDGKIVQTSFAVGPDFTGKGWGREILRQLVSAIRRDCPGASIQAWIFPENAASIKAHEAAGYRKDPQRGVRNVAMTNGMNVSIQACWVHSVDDQQSR